jgi:Nucleotidyltransferase domain
MKELHIYAFGSLCRGEVSPESDVDLLAAVSGGSNELKRSVFSIYSHRRLAEIWDEGNPFAWHLHLEAMLIFSHDGNDFLKMLGAPSPYARRVADCSRFMHLFRQARLSAEADSASIIFDLSAAFLGVRNFSSCFILGRGGFDFSRNVALALMGASPPISMDDYCVLERARILCTRGYGQSLTTKEIRNAVCGLAKLEDWMVELIRGLRDGE